MPPTHGFTRDCSQIASNQGKIRCRNILVSDYGISCTTLSTKSGMKTLGQYKKWLIAYSPSYNLALLISGNLIDQHLNFGSLMSPTCCSSPRKRTPVKYKKRQKAGFPIVT